MIDQQPDQMHPAKPALSPGDQLRQKFAAMKAERRRLLDRERSYFLASGHFSSRAAKMLNAALNESIKISSRPQEVKENTPDLSLNSSSSSSSSSSSDDDQEQDSETFIEQRRQASKSHKVVFFSKPLVTDLFYYEPTIVSHLVYHNGSDEDESYDQKQPAILMKIRRMSHGSPHSNKYNKIYRQTDNPREELKILTEKQLTNSSKREHDCDSDHNSELQGIKKLGLSSDDLDDCLFSPPKVAKVSPYFHDEDDDIDEIAVIKESRQMSSLVTSKPIRSQMVQQDIPQICSNEGQDIDSPCEYYDSSDQPANNCDDETDNLEYNEPNNIYGCASSAGQAEMNYTGYLSWFSDGMRLITSQLNKLIS